MICPNCQSGDVVVRDSRLVHGIRQRGRGCRACNACWLTCEVMVEGTLDVPKPEPAWWSLARGLKRRGLSDRTVAFMVDKAVSTVQHALRPTHRKARLARNQALQNDPEGRRIRTLKRHAAQEARA